MTALLRRLLLLVLAAGLAAGAALLALGCGDAPLPAAEPAPAATRSEAEIIADFERVWNARRAVFDNTFLGIRALQNPFDAWMVQEILSEVKPDFVVETGTFHGGSAAMWAMLLEHINPDARVITIDIHDRRAPKALALPIVKRRVDFLIGGSTDPEIVAEVHRRVGGARAVVMLDSLHTADHVYDELNAYAPLVPVGGYVVVQDTMVGPIRGIRRFLAENPNFEIDEKRERYIITNTDDGYLRRVR